MSRLLPRAVGTACKPRQGKAGGRKDTWRWDARYPSKGCRREATRAPCGCVWHQQSQQGAPSTLQEFDSRRFGHRPFTWLVSGGLVIRPLPDPMRPKCHRNVSLRRYSAHCAGLVLTERYSHWNLLAPLLGKQTLNRREKPEKRGSMRGGKVASLHVPEIR